ncbi:radical SAM protein [Paraburkholderia aromaticivorans]|uniref:radical SAM protein n=1 Tax=Paraburkholderia aromaticivorans TaxID=2026199 RepID=UPI0038B842A9
MIGADWEITKRCNQRCSFCLNNSGPEHRDILTTDDCFRIVDQLVEIGVFHVVITGGEPFVRPDIAEVLIYAASKNLIWTVTSNGSALTDSLIDKLSPIRSHFRSIQISLHALDAVTYEGYEISPTDLAASKANIIKLVKAGFVTTVICLFKGDNEAGVLEVYDWCSGHGVDGFISSQIKSSGRAIDSFSQFGSEKAKWIQLLSALYDKKNESVGPDLLISEPALFQKYANKRAGVDLIKYSCPAGTDTLMIKGNGDVYPCPFISEDCSGSIVAQEFRAGNIRESSLQQLMRTQAFARFNSNVESAQIFKGGVDQKCVSCGEHKAGNCRPCQLAKSDCHDSVRATTDFLRQKTFRIATVR